MIEIVPNNTENVMRDFAEEIRSVSRETMKTKEVSDLLSGISIDISITDKEKELLTYDYMILSTEILVSKKHSKKYSKIFHLVICTDLDDPSDDLSFVIVHGVEAEDLDPKDIFAVVQPIYGFEPIKDAYREALLTTLREIAN